MGNSRGRWSFLVLLAIIVVAFIPNGAPTREAVQAPVMLYYGPSADMKGVDQAILASARKSIDMAAYVLTDRGIMAALTEAAKRGVVVRLYVDGDEMMRDRANEAFDALIETKNISIKFKARKSDTMHLKTYVVDHRQLRTGSTNFSHSGIAFQDNDILVMDNAALSAAFLKNFEAMWTRPDNILASRAAR